MYWIEKIDLVKRRFSADKFKDPFRSGKEITRKIVLRLFKTTWLNFTQSDDRAVLLNRPIFIKQCSASQLYGHELTQLDSNENFWLLLVDVPMGPRFQVYDCKLEAIQELLYLSSGQSKQEFYIVDKKYAWLFLYKIDRAKDIVEIYKAEGENLAVK